MPLPRCAGPLRVQLELLDDERGPVLVLHGGAQVDAARVAFGETQRAVQAAAAERRALRDSTEAELRAIRAHRERLFFAYCSANVRARDGQVTPACFELVPPLELPAVFAEPIVSAA